jgi:DNA invertase Pin-like site-specific DNA recombinase
MDRPSTSEPAPGDRCLAYCRVSTDDQGDDGYSLDDQARTLTAFAASLGLILDTDDIFRETFSGARPVRPEFDRLLLRARQAPGRYRFILVAKWDRLERFDRRGEMDRAIFHHQIAAAGLRVLDVSQPHARDDSPTDALMRDILSAFAGYERELISQRTRMGREARAKEDGLYWGGRRPFGFAFAVGIRRGRAIERGRLVPHPDEAAVVRAIYRLFLDGTPIVAISRYLNRHAPLLVPTGSAHKKAGRWSAHAVRYILSNPAYAGRLIYNRTYGEEPRLTNNPYRKIRKTSRKLRPPEEWLEAKGAIDPIVDTSDWDRAQELLRERRAARTRAINPYVLRGLLYHECGTPATGHSRRRAPGDDAGLPPAGFARGVRDIMPLLPIAPLPGYAGAPEPFGYYDPHRYYACERCDSLTLAWKVENLVWHWVAAQLLDDAVLDRLLAAARSREATEADAEARLRGRLEQMAAERAALREQQSAARNLLGEPGWTAEQVAEGVARIEARVVAADAEIAHLGRDLADLRSGNPLSIEIRHRARLQAFISGFQWDYYSPRLWHMLIAYFVARVEWGRTRGRRNRGWLRITPTARLGSEPALIPLPYTVEQVIRSVETGPMSAFRFMVPGGRLNDPVREAAEADEMIALFGPPASVSPYLSLGASSAPAALERWLSVGEILARHEPTTISTRSPGVDRG